MIRDNPGAFTENREPIMADTLAVSNTSPWLTYALTAAIIGTVVATVVIATELSTPTVVVSSQSSAEQVFLRIMGPSTSSDALALGHRACRTMVSGQGTYAEYRRAEGALMAYQHVAPSYAQYVVHTALVSGLCLEHGGQIANR